MRYLKIIFLILLIPSVCFALDKNQRIVLDKCYSVSKLYGLHKQIPSICLTETSLGKNKRKTPWLGVMQIDFDTAKEILGDKKISDKKLKHKLKNNINFNVYVSCLILKNLIKEFKGDINKAVLAYNVGEFKVKKYGLKHDPNKYLCKVKNNSKIINEELI